mmetsp:Transcript_15028/g.25592  ORF Transcript_15028/g.25592 Transcript_15028/m.25592 type:complete len:237 (-) Transcript_15028:73-783(-)
MEWLLLKHAANSLTEGHVARVARVSFRPWIHRADEFTHAFGCFVHAAIDELIVMTQVLHLLAEVFGIECSDCGAHARSLHVYWSEDSLDIADLPRVVRVQHQTLYLQLVAQYVRAVDVTSTVCHATCLGQEVNMVRLRVLVLHGILTKLDIQAVPPPLVTTNVDENSAFTAVHFTLKSFQLLAAVASQRAEHVAGEAFAVDTGWHELASNKLVAATHMHEVPHATRPWIVEQLVVI